MAKDEQKTTALGDACTKACVAEGALLEARKAMVAAGVSASQVDVLIDDVRRLASGLGDAYLAGRS